MQNVFFFEEEDYEDFVKYMDENLGISDTLILFCSPDALNSEFVSKEWRAMTAMKKPIVPIYKNLDHIPPILKSVLGEAFDQWDLSKTTEEIYNTIMRKIRKRLEEKARS
ncbi:MAG: TIR domain-containing protein [Promethearchaeota archaeon]